MKEMKLENNTRREIITKSDLCEMLGIKSTTASKIMREVKSCSNVLNIKGIIHKLDWEAYLNRGKK